MEITDESVSNSTNDSSSKREEFSICSTIPSIPRNQEVTLASNRCEHSSKELENLVEYHNETLLRVGDKFRTKEDFNEYLNEHARKTTNCPCFVVLNKAKETDLLEVIKVCNHHDHPLTKETFQGLAHFRRLPTQLKNEFVDLHTLGVDNIRLRKYMKSKTGLTLKIKHLRTYEKKLKLASEERNLSKERLEQLNKKIKWINQVFGEKKEVSDTEHKVEENVIGTLSSIEKPISDETQTVKKLIRPNTTVNIAGTSGLNLQSLAPIPPVNNKDPKSKLIDKLEQQLKGIKSGINIKGDFPILLSYLLQDTTDTCIAKQSTKLLSEDKILQNNNKAGSCQSEQQKATSKDDVIHVTRFYDEKGKSFIHIDNKHKIHNETIIELIKKKFNVTDTSVTYNIFSNNIQTEKTICQKDKTKVHDEPKVSTDNENVLQQSEKKEQSYSAAALQQLNDIEEIVYYDDIYNENVVEVFESDSTELKKNENNEILQESVKLMICKRSIKNDHTYFKSDGGNDTATGQNFQNKSRSTYNKDCSIQKHSTLTYKGTSSAHKNTISTHQDTTSTHENTTPTMLVTNKKTPENNCVTDMTQSLSEDPSLDNFYRLARGGMKHIPLGRCTGHSEMSLHQDTDLVQPGDKFNSIGLFLEYINANAEKWCFYYCCRNSTINDGFYVYTCINKKYSQKQSKGLRKRVEKKTNCPCKIKLRRIPETETVLVTYVCHHHDHPVDKESFLQLQHGRRLSKELKEEVSAMLLSGLSTAAAKKYVETSTGLRLTTTLFVYLRNMARKRMATYTDEVSAKAKTLEEQYGTKKENQSPNKSKGKSKKRKTTLEPTTNDECKKSRLEACLENASKDINILQSVQKLEELMRVETQLNPWIHPLPETSISKKNQGHERSTHNHGIDPIGNNVEHCDDIEFSVANLSEEESNQNDDSFYISETDLAVQNINQNYPNTYGEHYLTIENDNPNNPENDLCVDEHNFSVKNIEDLNRRDANVNDENCYVVKQEIIDGIVNLNYNSCYVRVPIVTKQNPNQTDTNCYSHEDFINTEISLSFKNTTESTENNEHGVKRVILNEEALVQNNDDDTPGTKKSIDIVDAGKKTIDINGRVSFIADKSHPIKLTDIEETEYHVNAKYVELLKDVGIVDDLNTKRIFLNKYNIAELILNPDITECIERYAKENCMTVTHILQNMYKGKAAIEIIITNENSIQEIKMAFFKDMIRNSDIPKGKKIDELEKYKSEAKTYFNVITRLKEELVNSANLRAKVRDLIIEKEEIKKQSNEKESIILMKEKELLKANKLIESNKKFLQERHVNEIILNNKIEKDLTELYNLVNNAVNKEKKELMTEMEKIASERDLLKVDSNNTKKNVEKFLEHFSDIVAKQKMELEKANKIIALQLKLLRGKQDNIMLLSKQLQKKEIELCNLRKELTAFSEQKGDMCEETETRFAKKLNLQQNNFDSSDKSQEGQNKNNADIDVKEESEEKFNNNNKILRNTCDIRHKLLQQPNVSKEKLEIVNIQALPNILSKEVAIASDVIKCSLIDNRLEQRIKEDCKDLLNLKNENTDSSDKDMSEIGVVNKELALDTCKTVKNPGIQNPKPKRKRRRNDAQVNKLPHHEYRVEVKIEDGKIIERKMIYYDDKDEDIND